MLSPEFTMLLAKERIADLRRDAQRRPRLDPPAPRLDRSEIELRLRCVHDGPALERLATLAERPLPFGELVVAVRDGRIVAALPLGGGHALRDPFERTAPLLPLLELRRDQILQIERRRPWSFLRRRRFSEALQAAEAQAGS